MPCECKILAVSPPGRLMKKGYVAAIRNQSRLLIHPWASSEGLPKFVTLVISDADRSQVAHFMDNWRIKFLHSIVNENAAGFRVRIEVHPGVVASSGRGRAKIKAVMQAWVAARDGSIFAFSADGMTVDLPKPQYDIVGLVALKSEFEDDFGDELESAVMYYFTEAEVDSVIAAGGSVTRTKAQVLALIKAKLDD